MCSPGGCRSCGVPMGCCCCPTRPCQPPPDKLRPADKHGWFQQCLDDSCGKCKSENENYLVSEDDDYLLSHPDCICICRRNRHIIEALSCLFRCSVQFMVSMLFKLAYQQHQPLQRFPRDRVWDVMEHVKAPYTELNDLEIYDSMYDRCGLPIDPLDSDNYMKILRMMFLLQVLTPDQRSYLMHMLEQLNARAYCPVHIELLLQTLEGIELKKLVCSLRQQEELTRRLYTGRKCSAICHLYQKVATVDKHRVTQNRRKHRRKYKASLPDPQHPGEDVPATRQSALNRQFCVRKPVENADSPRSSVRSPSIHRASQAGPRRTRYSSISNRQYYMVR